MSEKELIELGFQKSYCDDLSYYYVIDLHNKEFTLITKQCSDQVINDKWSVLIFDSNVEYHSTEEVETLINSINRVKSNRDLLEYLSKHEVIDYYDIDEILNDFKYNS